MQEIIILNKIFTGGWLKDGNIGHEVIDFLATDAGDYYVYNNPWGVCPEDIWVDGTKKLTRSKKEKYSAKYLVLTSEMHDHSFNILYVIELEEKLHRKHTKRNIDDEFIRNQDTVKDIIRKRNIKYNDKYLYEIYGDDKSLYVTFKAKKYIKLTNL